MMIKLANVTVKRLYHAIEVWWARIFKISWMLHGCWGQRQPMTYAHTLQVRSKTGKDRNIASNSDDEDRDESTPQKYAYTRPSVRDTVWESLAEFFWLNRCCIRFKVSQANTVAYLFTYLWNRTATQRLTPTNLWAHDSMTTNDKWRLEL
jgi:hypothetical protein